MNLKFVFRKSLLLAIISIVIFWVYWIAESTSILKFTIGIFIGTFLIIFIMHRIDAHFLNQTMKILYKKCHPYKCHKKISKLNQHYKNPKKKNQEIIKWNLYNYELDCLVHSGQIKNAHRILNDMEDYISGKDDDYKLLLTFSRAHVAIWEKNPYEAQDYITKVLEDIEDHPHIHRVISDSLDVLIIRWNILNGNDDITYNNLLKFADNAKNNVFKSITYFTLAECYYNDFSYDLAKQYFQKSIAIGNRLSLVDEAKLRLENL